MGIIQGTEEWLEIRRGKVTASRISDVMMEEKKAGYRNYLAQLAAERLTGRIEETYCSYDMQRGTDLEPLARSLYCFEKNSEVEEVAFVDHPFIPMMGCSPDGLVGDRGQIEIKCPKSAQHQDLLLGGDIDRKYVLQMQMQMSCTGRDWTDYVSFDPTMPEELMIKVIRVPRDQKLIEEIGKASIQFLKKVEQRVNALSELMKS